MIASCQSATGVRYSKQTRATTPVAIHFTALRRSLVLIGKKPGLGCLSVSPVAAATATLRQNWYARWKAQECTVSKLR